MRWQALHYPEGVPVGEQLRGKPQRVAPRRATRPQVVPEPARPSCGLFLVTVRVKPQKAARCLWADDSRGTRCRVG